jgi:hypothetical protein
MEAKQLLTHHVSAAWEQLILLAGAAARFPSLHGEQQTDHWIREVICLKAKVVIDSMAKVLGDAGAHGSLELEGQVMVANNRLILMARPPQEDPASSGV